MKILLGPFTELLTMRGLPLKGPIDDDSIEIIRDGALLTENNKIIAVGTWRELRPLAHKHQETDRTLVCLPGLIDSHTHLCWAGSRAQDYVRRLKGMSYQEIARAGGGILDTVTKTRQASEEELVSLLLERCTLLKARGIMTCEVKSGYGLSIPEELKILRAIQKASRLSPISLIPTCLAAHVCPPEYPNNISYLKACVNELFPVLKAEQLTTRIDIFVDEGAFTVEEARWYLLEAKKQGFEIVLHADQFTRGGALLAAELHACSADHLECSGPEEAKALAKASIAAIVLPGASLGLGMPYPPARMLLDSGVCLVIASDWNPGSAPMGQLLTQAAILGMQQKLSMAETWAAITCRAAHALNLNDRGVLDVGKRADFICYPCKDYREILYAQGSIMPFTIKFY